MGSGGLGRRVAKEGPPSLGQRTPCGDEDFLGLRPVVDQLLERLVRLDGHHPGQPVDREEFLVHDSTTVPQAGAAVEHLLHQRDRGGNAGASQRGVEGGPFVRRPFAKIAMANEKEQLQVGLITVIFRQQPGGKHPNLDVVVLEGLDDELSGFVAASAGDDVHHFEPDSEILMFQDASEELQSVLQLRPLEDVHHVSNRLGTLGGEFFDDVGRSCFGELGNHVAQKDSVLRDFDRFQRVEQVGDHRGMQGQEVARDVLR